MGTTAPLQLLWVFSTQMSEVLGIWTEGFLILCSTTSGDMAPLSEEMGRGVTRAMNVI